MADGIITILDEVDKSELETTIETLATKNETYTQYGWLTDADLLTWALAQTSNQIFSINPSVTTTGVPSVAWYVGRLTIEKATRIVELFYAGADADAAVDTHTYVNRYTENAWVGWSSGLLTSGGTMTGNLKISTSLPDAILTNTNTGVVTKLRTGSYSAQVMCYDDISDENNYRRLVIYSPDGHDLTHAIEFHDMVDGTNNIYHVYGSHNIPTLSTLGAAPEYGYGTTDLTAGTSPLATGHLFFVYK